MGIVRQELKDLRRMIGGAGGPIGEMRRNSTAI